jgi:hypothetical protein
MRESKNLRLQEALARHREAVEAFAAAASTISPGDWDRGVAEGKWSPAQIAEHLCLSLEAVRRELDGGVSMRILLPFWKRYLLRRAVLPCLLATGRFPAGVRAPREIRPAIPTASKEEALSRLERLADEFGERFRADPRSASRRLAHPFFGSLPAHELVLILAWHARHHRGQLPGAQ